MDKHYNPENIEKRWYAFWEQKNHFAPQGSGEPYCIMIPPPNVTGSLHMGHAFQDTLMDTLIRYYRMKGRRTLWQAGTDHAGIATQMVVERNLKAENKTRHDLGRDAFLQRVWDWKAQSGGTITQQLRRLGASLDWSRERFTLDEGLNQAVLEVFVRLHEEGLIYRGQRLVNWDPVLHTAVSDLEVVASEENGYLWHIRYPLVDGDGHLVVATTRPETLLGDAAVAVHPDDDRYRALIGKRVHLPLTDRTIPIIADDFVDKEFGTGCVKITPAHDFNDYEVSKRHELPLITILTLDAKLNDQCPEAYRGLDRFDARKRMVADLERLGLMASIEPYKLKVPRGDRSGAIIEPLLTDQWFVKAAPLAQPALRAVETGQILFVPDHWKNTFYDWMHNIQDWCISRQIWWGHRIPAWYDPNGRCYVGRSEQAVREKYHLDAKIPLKQDEDVLDTWFSSALWPFSTLGWPEASKDLKDFYPTQVLVTGFDIIFFWVARMIMMGLKLTDQVPFREVYITGLVRDAHGQKMSKSKGNVLDPLDVIDGIELDALLAKRSQGLMQPEMAEAIQKSTCADYPQGIAAYGTDALRFTCASLATMARDINFDTKRIEGYRNFCNKLWNAARYVMLNTEDQDCGQNNADPYELNCVDQWIVSRLQETLQDVERHFKHYRFDLAAQAIYDFTWNDYCDWYLELTKPVLTDATSTPIRLRGTRKTLVRVLEALLRIAHPIIPFVTEEIWQQIAPLAGVRGDTLMLQPFPIFDARKIFPDAVRETEWIKAVILGVRQIRSGMNIEPRKRLLLLLGEGKKSDQTNATVHAAYLMSVGRLESITWLADVTQAPESATALAGDLRILIPLAGLIDKQAELARLEREIMRKQQEAERLAAKLSNDHFVARAPAEVVAKERERLNEAQSGLIQLREQLLRIQTL